ncbi:hypothetical protein HDU96_010412 [Phlyctochytrium bullatum]|nr:hypothetical protein HDU96_010412 [Phlyctochytrium bullatum]
MKASSRTPRPPAPLTLVRDVAVLVSSLVGWAAMAAGGTLALACGMWAAVRWIVENGIGRQHPAAVVLVLGTYINELMNFTVYWGTEGVRGAMIQLRSSTIVNGTLPVVWMLVLAVSAPEWNRLGAVAGSFVNTWLGYVLWTFEYARVNGEIGKGDGEEAGRAWTVAGGTIASWITLTTVFVAMATMQIPLVYTATVLPVAVALYIAQVVNFYLYMRKFSDENEPWYLKMRILACYQFPMKMLRVYRPLGSDLQSPTFWAVLMLLVLVDRLQFRLVYWYNRAHRRDNEGGKVHPEERKGGDPEVVLTVEETGLGDKEDLRQTAGMAWRAGDVDDANQAETRDGEKRFRAASMSRAAANGLEPFATTSTAACDIGSTLDSLAPSRAATVTFRSTPVGMGGGALGLRKLALEGGSKRDSLAPSSTTTGNFRPLATAEESGSGRDSLVPSRVTTVNFRPLSEDSGNERDSLAPSRAATVNFRTLISVDESGNGRDSLAPSRAATVGFGRDARVAGRTLTASSSMIGIDGGLKPSPSTELSSGGARPRSIAPSTARRRITEILVHQRPDTDATYVVQRNDMAFSSLANTLCCLSCVWFKGKPPVWIPLNETRRLELDASLLPEMRDWEFALVVMASMGLEVAVETLLVALEACWGIPVGKPRRLTVLEVLIFVIRFLNNLVIAATSINLIFGYGL